MKKPVVKLVGTDGNVFSIIGKTSSALKKAGMNDEAAKFREEAFSAGSYNKVLQLVMTYCEVR